MPGFARSRTQGGSEYISGGYYNLFNSPPQQTRHAYQIVRKDMDDVVGNRLQANSLKLISTHTAVPTLDGEYKINGTVYKKFTGCPIGYTPTAPSPQVKWPDPTLLDKNNMAWNILAKTNPSAAVVSLPTFLAELKDIPGMVKGAGENVLKDVARGHLTARWFINPLVSDFKKMLNFAKAVDDRMALFRHLQKKGWKGIRMGIATEPMPPETRNVFVHSEGCSVYCKATTTYACKAWGSAKWKISGTTRFPASSLDMRKYAERIVAGITAYEAVNTAWELLPWSWLADWFLGLGQVLAAQNNTVGLTYSNLCWMRTSSASTTYEVIKGPSTSDWITLQGGHFEETEWKQRFTVTPFLPFAPSTLPFLSGRCWSILGSLAVLRR